MKKTLKSNIISFAFLNGRQKVKKTFSSYHCCNVAEEDGEKVGMVVVAGRSILLGILISQWHKQEYNP